MPIYHLILRNRRDVARGTIVLTFEKPAGFQFKAGQYGGFTLINPPEADANGITRRFSLLSAPDDTYLEIATRIQQSAYKRVLSTLAIGSEVKFAGPTGTFTLHEDTTIPAVCIAGGIGIAPFYSMIHDAILHQPNRQIHLFYGNQSPEDTAFLSELNALAAQHPQFTFVPTVTQSNDNWQGEVGFITYEMLKKYIPAFTTPIYYICGSPVMVTTFQELLAESGISEENIKVEDFPGY
ncbi:MAG TPA: FAD-dependent oxidoreductase [Gammaproteobacteria bacterium]|jgi:ferredoxin-NADP reductase|nr:FAD-dependent oxidoreductase [Gammaproteobacteria bacterium]